MTTVRQKFSHNIYKGDKMIKKTEGKVKLSEIGGKDPELLKFIGNYNVIKHLNN